MVRTIEEWQKILASIADDNGRAMFLLKSLSHYREGMVYGDEDRQQLANALTALARNGIDRRLQTLTNALLMATATIEVRAVTIKAEGGPLWEELYKELMHLVSLYRGIAAEHGQVPQPALAGCSVCGIGADGKPYAYACSRNDCPTRVG